jgi:hypothetical protein
VGIAICQNLNINVIQIIKMVCEKEAARGWVSVSTGNFLTISF